MSNQTDVDSVAVRLREQLGERVSASPEDRGEHAHDVSYHTHQPPDLVVWPETDEEVSFVVRTCVDARVPMIPFGTGTAVEGGVIATHGGVTLDLRRMNDVLRVDPLNRDATVQAGVTRFQLNDHVAEHGLYFPVDPGADASLGGMAATRASGASAVGYGTMRENVLGLKAVMPDGSVVETGTRARKSSAGYDLTRLLVGSEGTLGVITEVTLRLTRKPRCTSAAVCAFDSIDATVAAAFDVLDTGVRVTRLELLDEVMIEAANQYSRLENDVTPTLFLEFHGSETAVAESSRLAEELAGRHGGRGFRWATEQADRDRLWRARYDCYFACLAIRDVPAAYGTDVCVPISNLAEAVVTAKRWADELPFPAPVFGHVGDGNFHVICVVDPNAPVELAAARAFGDRLVDLALRLDGTCTGEHGIGLGKRDALAREAGPALDVMRTIKRALDPYGLMNPGKVLRGGDD